jgi:hypothetical protein
MNKRDTIPRLSIKTIVNTITYMTDVESERRRSPSARRGAVPTVSELSSGSAVQHKAQEAAESQMTGRPVDFMAPSPTTESADDESPLAPLAIPREFLERGHAESRPHRFTFRSILTRLQQADAGLIATPTQRWSVAQAAIDECHLLGLVLVPETPVPRTPDQVEKRLDTCVITLTPDGRALGLAAGQSIGGALDGLLPRFVHKHLHARSLLAHIDQSAGRAAWIPNATKAAHIGLTRNEPISEALVPRIKNYVQTDLLERLAAVQSRGVFSPVDLPAFATEIRRRSEIFFDGFEFDGAL